MTGQELPRRDWILMPVISLVTIVIISGSAEYVARLLFPELTTAGEDCIEFHDPALGPHGRPNSLCREKIPDGNLVEYRFNDCGDRTDLACGVKPAGTYRIVLLGSSVAIGMRVSLEDSFGASLPAELSHRTGLKIDLYNKAMVLREPDLIERRFDDVLAAKPDLILWSIHPNDVQRQARAPLPVAGYEEERAQGLVAKAWHRLRMVAAKGSVTASITEVFTHTRTYTLLCYLLYTAPDQYVRSYLLQPDTTTGYLRSEPTAEWRQRLLDFEEDAAGILAKASAANVPLVAVLLPTRAQAAMITTGDWPAGFDPYRLDEELRPIIERHGGVYFDLLAAMRAIPRSDRVFFPVDGHPNGLGHAVFSEILATDLTSGPVTALRVTASEASVERSH